MKYTTKIIICAALVCIGAGIICAAVGAVVDGKPDNMPAVKNFSNKVRYYEYNYGNDDDYYNDDFYYYYYGDYGNDYYNGKGGGI